MSDVTSLAHWLPAEQAPWHLDFERWPQAQAQRWRAVLAVNAQGRCTLLADRALDALLLQSVESRLQLPVRWRVCEAAAVEHWLGAGEADFRALSDVDEAMAGSETHAADAEELSALRLSEQASPVVRLLNATLYDALQDGASDVHIECTARGAVIRFRIDGVMAQVRQVDGAAVAEQLVSRLKVMSELDIGERRLPQDGRFKLKVRGRAIDFRVSIMPTIHGEDAVIRILDKENLAEEFKSLSLEILGFSQHELTRLRRFAKEPYGMFLVTGPTGSGKTTTLYAILSEIRNPEDKIITIEDPVEYQLEGVTQIPVNEKKGLTFALGLRSILRHDPDKILVGEIRDPETAAIAIQSALTGHLVFTTVHANNVFDVLGRFEHMGVPVHNFVSALNCVLAQRLVKVLCTKCKKPHTPTAQELKDNGMDAAWADKGTFFEKGGCVDCHGTGFRGRQAIIEFLGMNDEVRELMTAQAGLREIKAAARRSGMQSLRESALEKVRLGLTTFAEINKVTFREGS